MKATVRPLGTFLVFLLMLLPFRPFAPAALADAPPEAAKPDAKSVAEPAASPDTDGDVKKAHMPDLTDNDVYLFTPEIWSMAQRMARGEFFDMDAELEHHIQQRPYVYSAHFADGILKTRRLFLYPQEKKDDRVIQERFNTCIDLAKKAQSLPKFRDSGLFYEALCNGGLAFYHGVRRNYMKTHGPAVRAIKLMRKLRKLRPDLHGGLLMMGIYNYYTGRFGFFAKLVLRLIGVEPGDKDLGLKQIRLAASGDHPLRYFTDIYAVYVFSPRGGSVRKEAYAIADRMVRQYPDNYYPYMLRAYVADKMRRYKEALADNLRGRAKVTLSADELSDPAIAADVFMMECRANYLKALLHRDDAALSWLVRETKNRSYRWVSAPQVAYMHLGHLYTQADLWDKGMAFYEKMQDFDGGEWLKDLGKKYEDRPMGKRRRLSREQREKLNAWLLRHPEVKP